jgi:hypothetical protein
MGLRHGSLMSNRNWDPEKRAAWRAQNRDKLRKWADEWRAKNPEKLRAQKKAWRERNLEKARASENALWAKNPEKHRKLEAIRRARRKSDPMYKLCQRVSASLRGSLTKGKKGTPAFILLGYTKEQLAIHLERQFLPKMGWHNIAEWHIDHITPLAAFDFQSPNDPDFKMAWALTNLRPVWATANLSKGPRREFLL